MTDFAATDVGYTVEGYFDLVRSGVMDENDHVELLEGLVVASPPQGSLHAAVLTAADASIRRAVADRATIRVQMPFVAGPRSVPEPDLAVVPGRPFDYLTEHPSEALLVVEVADSSLPHDRLTKSRIYAAAGVPEYWILNLRERCLEVFTNPNRERRLYVEVRKVPRGGVVELTSLPGATVAAAELLPAW